MKAASRLASTFSGLTLQARIAGAALLLLVLACGLGPVVFHLIPPNQADFGAIHEGLGAPGHPLGTDDLGRDLLSRSLYGGQVSLVVGFASVALGFAAGGLIGMIAGYLRGIPEVALMRLLDILLAFPALVLALTIATYLGPSERNVILAIGVFTTPVYARLARAGTLELRSRDFVAYAEMSGGRTAYILVRHIVPNLLSALLTYAFLAVGIAMLVEAALSFLGLGIPPPQATWGSMIANGRQSLALAPQGVLVPGAFLLATVLALNVMADGLRRRRRAGAVQPERRQGGEVAEAGLR